MSIYHKSEQPPRTCSVHNPGAHECGGPGVCPDAMWPAPTAEQALEDFADIVEGPIANTDAEDAAALAEVSRILDNGGES